MTKKSTGEPAQYRHNYYTDYVQSLETIELFRRDQKTDYLRYQDQEAMLAGYRNLLLAAKYGAEARDGYVKVLEERLQQQREECSRVTDQRQEAQDALRKLMAFLEPTSLDEPVAPALEEVLTYARKVL